MGIEDRPSDNHRVLERLAALRPGSLDQPNAARALRELKLKIERREDSNMLGIAMSKNMRRAAAGIAVAGLLAGLLMIPTVQAAASEFLSIFRVEKFVLVNVDQERMEQIRAAMEANMGYEEEDEQPPVEPVTVGSVEEAAGLTGFMPLTTDQYGAVADVQVSGAAQKTFTPHVDEIRAVYEALGLDPMLIPDNIDGQPFEVTLSPGIAIGYEGSGDSGQIAFMQMPSPIVNVPDGVDMKQLGKAMLMLLGMDEAQATAMSDSIDWATTLIVPIPTDAKVVQEVTARGRQGLLFDNRDDDGSGGAMLVWQENGYVMVAAGESPTVVTTFVETLK